MKTYGQFCSVAKSLDVIGDRWTLLILRELLFQGPCRYTDLANGLPGIASNLLSDRLKSLEGAGLLHREAAPPPVATTLFHLTERGRTTEPVLAALSRWGAEFVQGTPSSTEEFRSYWFPYSVAAYLRDRAPGAAPVSVQLVTPIGSWVITVDDAGTGVREGTTEVSALSLDGHPRLILGLLSGSHTLDDVRAEGMVVGGNPEVLATFPLVAA